MEAEAEASFVAMGAAEEEQLAAADALLDKALDSSMAELDEITKYGTTELKTLSALETAALKVSKRLSHTAAATANRYLDVALATAVAAAAAKAAHKHLHTHFFPGSRVYTDFKKELDETLTYFQKGMKYNGMFSSRVGLKQIEPSIPCLQNGQGCFSFNFCGCSCLYQCSVYKFEKEMGGPDADRTLNTLSSEWTRFLLFQAWYFVFLFAFSLLSTAAVVYAVACIYTGK